MEVLTAANYGLSVGLTQLQPPQTVLAVQTPEQLPVLPLRVLDGCRLRQRLSRACVTCMVCGGKNIRCLGPVG